MCFLRNGSLYSFETCTIVISMPGNLSMHLVWPSKYKGKWCFIPKCVFSEMNRHTALKLVPLQSAHLKTSGCTEFGPLNTKESDVLFQNVFSQKWIIVQLWNLYHCDQHAWKPQYALSLALQIQRKVMFYSKMCFLRNGSLYNFETFTIVIGMPGNLSMHLVWPSKYKGKWCFIPKCVFSEMDQHTALTLVAMQLACLRTSGCAEFGPLNTKESDVLFQNVFSQKQIIIQLWNWDHCNWHTWKPQGLLSLALQIHRKVMFYSKMCFLRNGSLYNFDTCTMVIGMPGNLSVHLVWPSKYKGKWCFIPKCVMFYSKMCFLRNRSSYSFETGTIAIDTPENLRVCWVWPSKYKESGVLFQNVFYQKQIIIQLWNLYHCDQHAWKPQYALSLAL